MDVANLNFASYDFIGGYIKIFTWGIWSCEPRRGGSPMSLRIVDAWVNFSNPQPDVHIVLFPFECICIHQVCQCASYVSTLFTLRVCLTPVLFLLSRT